MSTIHDALKKVERNMQTPNPGPSKPSYPQSTGTAFNAPPRRPETEYPDPRRQDPPVPSGKNISAQKRFPILILLVIISALGFVSIRTFQKLNPGTALGKFQIPFLKKHPKTTPPPSPAGRTYKHSDFFLQGIMTRGNKNIALINNTLYETGDSVNSLIITDISKTTVTLTDDAGNKKILKTAK